MTRKNQKQWVLPTLIPFADLKSKDLEECVYWLLDAMGAKNLEWRKGGTGNGASDGGRDLEATFYEPDKDGNLTAQQWWIECKGRQGTVDPDEVKSAVVNAMVRKNLARIVIATNTQFSNPTRDWVKEWQNTHPMPTVILWDQITLERYLSEHPQVVLRLFSHALSPEGLARAMQSRFWNRLEYMPIKVLRDLWKERHNLTFEVMALFAAIANEFAHGDITQRPWAAGLSGEAMLEVLGIGLINVPYLITRGGTSGVEMRPIVRSLAYLILACLENVEVDELTIFIEEQIYRGKKDEWPKEVRELVLMPIADQLRSEMEDICTADCRRILGRRRNVLFEDRDEVDSYWDRFAPEKASKEGPQRYAWIEANDTPCIVGFKVDADNGCPLIHFDATPDNLQDLLKIIKKVAAFRKNQAIQKREAPKQR